MASKAWYLGLAGTGLVTCLAVAPVVISARQAPGAAIRIDKDDVGGVVASDKGPEAGVWVIAETKDLPTKYVKIVVTDDQGRYVLPDLPPANYEVWVRGYGLVDSPKVKTAPGKTLNLKAVIAPDARAAAQYYPASYWFSLIHIPPKSDFPGTGISGNGISQNIKTQEQFIDRLKGCNACHQVGTEYFRTIPKALEHMSSFDAWGLRTQSGQLGRGMTQTIAGFGRERFLRMMADWTDRIKNGEYPQTPPPRPQGVERNVVITMWDWADQYAFIHDAAAVDKRNPTLNPDGPFYGVSRFSAPDLHILYPKENSTVGVTAPVRNPEIARPDAFPGYPRAEQNMMQPSLVWGDKLYWTGAVLAHNPMLDEKNRVWTTQSVRPPVPAAWCGPGSNHPSAKFFPIVDVKKSKENYAGADRQLAMWDPATKRWTLIDTCSGSHSLHFAEDANRTLWFSNQGQVMGWLNTKLFDETKDEQKSQGWMPYILDTNGNGKVDAWVEPDDPVDPAKDKRIRGGSYGIQPNPVDGSVWTATAGTGGGVGAIIRVNPGANPPSTAISEIYEPPIPSALPRGIDVDRKTGIVWTAFAGSGHIASFDRSKCKVLNGPTATGQHCPEGWTVYEAPEPKFVNATDSTHNVEYHYRAWVDWFNTFGFGENVPIANGTGSDSLKVLLPGGKFVVVRVPYPLGFFSRSVDGRIDNPKTGWKGRGGWANYGEHTPWHIEGGKGTTSKAVKFQVRPDPLAH